MKNKKIISVNAKEIHLLNKNAKQYPFKIKLLSCKQKLATDKKTNELIKAYKCIYKKNSVKKTSTFKKFLTSLKFKRVKKHIQNKRNLLEECSKKITEIEKLFLTLLEALPQKQNADFRSIVPILSLISSNELVKKLINILGNQDNEQTESILISINKLYSYIKDIDTCKKTPSHYKMIISNIESLENKKRLEDTNSHIHKIITFILNMKIESLSFPDTKLPPKVRELKRYIYRAFFIEDKDEKAWKILKNIFEKMKTGETVPFLDWEEFSETAGSGNLARLESGNFYKMFPYVYLPKLISTHFNKINLKKYYKYPCNTLDEISSEFKEICHYCGYQSTSRFYHAAVVIYGKENTIVADNLQVLSADRTIKTFDTLEDALKKYKELSKYKKGLNFERALYIQEKYFESVQNYLAKYPHTHIEWANNGCELIAEINICYILYILGTIISKKNSEQSSLPLNIESPLG